MNSLLKPCEAAAGPAWIGVGAPITHGDNLPQWPKRTLHVQDRTEPPEMRITSNIAQKHKCCENSV
ncbi:MAG TPA: hypothetical protein VMF08_13850 [Candidatus Sulfotelmatobacter sp.]|nr:hypothetical protein [Candidatus Sulfotelmatobacter sp.]